ncbi:hypothetical protein BN77_p10840 [Rhizobium mesoamericanum STM3625]|uniref:Transmembrane protein n=2 Tax=Rhizobium mesoamericanum TaxID=1079800 RepID=K0PS33_9HYPH|nr:hypothetical protein BN77_p10840 [Rhizobium mesoamericanum STM3625]
MQYIARELANQPRGWLFVRIFGDYSLVPLRWAAMRLIPAGILVGLFVWALILLLCLSLVVAQAAYLTIRGGPVRVPANGSKSPSAQA